MSDAVEIFNFTTATASFDIYVANAVSTADGGLAPAAADAEPTGAATWVTVNESRVEVARNSARSVGFTVKVPTGTQLGHQTVALLVAHQGSGVGNIESTTRIGLWVKITVTAGPGPGGLPTPWGWPWIVLVPLFFLIAAWLAYVTRDRRRRWLQDRQEERALIRDLRKRRHHGDDSDSHS